MAVYTKIDNQDLLSLSNSYKLGKITKSKGIKKGIENTNYLLKTNKRKFILTIFEKRVQKKRLAFFHESNGKTKSKKNCLSKTVEE